MSTNLEDEERALGEWPRRLLYVPDMISYAWQPGNTYNGIKEPEYNALTYTWGRWRLKEQERLDVEALDMTIDGDSWPIPRVDPEHFTAENFELAINYATFKPLEEGDGVDFIWLDIACIAQREDPRADAEIGRQALIFRGARYVYMWLTTVSASELKKILDDMWWIEGEQPAEYTVRHSRANRGIVRLLGDPWFSSLWTLQEAFLRQDAYLLSSDPTLIERSHVDQLCGLSDILVPCSSWRWFYNRIMAGLTDQGEAEFDEADRAIRERGLNALSSQHEISTYIAAQRRTASREDDRIYGLQQVFRLRLGKTALNRTTVAFNISELENQFGEALLLQHPVHSQMHVFASHVPAHNRWRIRSCSRELRDDAFRLPVMFDERLPQIIGPPPTFTTRNRSPDDSPLNVNDFVSPEDAIWQSRSNAMIIHCSFSMGDATSTPRPVMWKGLMCPFTKLLRVSKHIYANVHLSRRQELIDDKVVDELEPLPSFPLFVDLDAVNELPSVCMSNLTSMDVTAFLEQNFPDFELQILLLGSCWPAYTREGYKHGMFGLLMLWHEERWVRVGVCQWSCEADWGPRRLQLSADEELLLSGNGMSWVQVDGTLGYVD
jgi:hypothetical protein